MSYIYWTMTLCIFALCLYCLQKYTSISKRILHFAWQLLILRILIPINLPNMLSVYNVVNKQFKLDSLPAHYLISDADILKVSRLSTASVNHYIDILIFIGFIFFLVWLIRLINNLRGYISNSCEVIDENFSKYCLPMHNVKLLQSSNINSPASCRLIKHSYIFIPENFEITESTVLILEHEYAHILRRDTYWKLLSNFTLLLHWFNPICWLIYICFNRSIEMACDEAVLMKYGENYRSKYARQLIAYGASTVSKHTFSSFKSSQNIYHRILSIMKFKVDSRAKKLITILLICTISLCLATNAIPKRTILETEILPVASSDSNIKVEHPEPKEFLLSVDDSNRIGSHIVYSSQSYLYGQQNAGWKLKKGAAVKINFCFDTPYRNGQAITIFYRLGETTSKDHRICFIQAKDRYIVNFIVPEDAIYFFGICSYTSEPLIVDSVTITPN